jgi:hypothetical protein
MAWLFPFIPFSWGLPDTTAIACAAGVGLLMPRKFGAVIEALAGSGLFLNRNLARRHR